MANWGRSDCGTPSWCNGADVNNDGTVDEIDAYILMAQWLNESCHLNAKNIIMSQRIKGSKVLLAFVSGTTLDIDNRMQSIGSGRFLGLASPTFASGLGATHVVKVLLNYTGMDVVSDLILQEGRHNLMIENTGKSGGRQMIKVRSL
ncbi:MAG: hypothetical protein DRO99_02970 [Candidatus Aenigmatarchaeota archaeon]|nr:MAG: hypothetical protein DRO99_02970 [Candidatus Aenigmarchaeota archaeon]